MKIRLFALSLPLFFLLSPLQAQDEERGRLPDGRAYRTDAEGNQLVDYIAELELEVDSLKRQVQGLEDETQEKQAVIDRLQSGKGGTPEIRERNLVGGTAPVRAAAVKCEPQVVERVVEKVVEKPVYKECSGDPSEVRELRAEAQRLERELEKSKEALSAANLRIEEREIDLEIANAKIKAQGEALKSNEVKTASLRRGSGPIVIQSQSAQRPRIQESRIRAVDMLRKTMIKDLRSLEDLLAYRDKLYARVDKSKFSPPEKINIQSLRTSVERSEQVHDLSTIRTKINEQRGKAQQDIALYKRDLKH